MVDFFALLYRDYSVQPKSTTTSKQQQSHDKQREQDEIPRRRGSHDNDDISLPFPGPPALCRLPKQVLLHSARLQQPIVPYLFLLHSVSGNGVSMFSNTYWSAFLEASASQSERRAEEWAETAKLIADDGGTGDADDDKQQWLRRVLRMLRSGDGGDASPSLSVPASQPIAVSALAPSASSVDLFALD